jgi:hypothetical protein
VIVPKSYENEEAIKVAVEDLKNAGAAHGIAIRVMPESGHTKGDVILVGGPADNALARQMRDAGTLVSSQSSSVG